MSMPANGVDVVGKTDSFGRTSSLLPHRGATVELLERRLMDD